MKPEKLNQKFTRRQALGEFGEEIVQKFLGCAVCEKISLDQLPRNTPLVDLVCKNCNAKFQVKTLLRLDSTKLPKKLIGAAWRPQKEALELGLQPGIFIVLVQKTGPTCVYFLPSEDQNIEIFEPRKPLSEKAKSPGWQGFMVNIGLANKPPNLVWSGTTHLL